MTTTRGRLHSSGLRLGMSGSESFLRLIMEFPETPE